MHHVRVDALVKYLFLSSYRILNLAALYTKCYYNSTRHGYAIKALNSLPHIAFLLTHCSEILARFCGKFRGMFARRAFPLYIVTPYNTFTDNHPPRGPKLNTLYLTSNRTECAIVHYVLLGIMAVQVRIARDYFRSIVRPPLAYVGVCIIRVA